MKLTDEMLYKYAAEARDIRLSEFPQSKDSIPERPTSRSYQRKMKRLLKRQRIMSRGDCLFRYTRCVAIIVLVLLTVTIIYSPSAEAIRTKFIEIISQVFIDRTEITYSTDMEAKELPGISFDYFPKELKQIEQQSDEVSRFTRYESADGTEVVMLYETLIDKNGDYWQLVDTEDAIVDHFTIHGEQAMSAQKNDLNTIVWTKGQVAYSLYGNVPLDEMKKIAFYMTQKNN